MYKEDLSLNNLKLLICHKTKPTKPINDMILYNCEETINYKSVEFKNYDYNQRFTSDSALSKP